MLQVIDSFFYRELERDKNPGVKDESEVIKRVPILTHEQMLVMKDRMGMLMVEAEAEKNKEHK